MAYWIGLDFKCVKRGLKVGILDFKCVKRGDRFTIFEANNGMVPPSVVSQWHKLS